VGFDPRSWEVALWRWTSAPSGRHRSSPGRVSMLPDARSSLAGSIRGPWCLRCYLAWRTADERYCSWSPLCRCPSLRARRTPGASLAEPVMVRVTGPGRPAPALLSRRPGLAQGAWMLRSLAAAAHGLIVTTQPAHWRRGAAQLLLAETFVSAAWKPVPVPGGQHAADAAAAGLAMVELLETSDMFGSDVHCSPRESFSLLAAMAMWTGLRIDPGELRQEVLVVAARPRSRH
jgi:hypothetical protein